MYSMYAQEEICIRIGDCPLHLKQRCQVGWFLPTFSINHSLLNELQL